MSIVPILIARRSERIASEDIIKYSGAIGAAAPSLRAAAAIPRLSAALKGSIVVAVSVDAKVSAPLQIVSIVAIGSLLIVLWVTSMAQLARIRGGHAHCCTIAACHRTRQRPRARTEPYFMDGRMFHLIARRVFSLMHVPGRSNIRRVHVASTAAIVAGIFGTTAVGVATLSAACGGGGG